jgi:hypothetical protein
MFDFRPARYANNLPYPFGRFPPSANEERFDDAGRVLMRITIREILESGCAERS